MQEKNIEFKKVTNVRLPYDMRSEDPGKNYGIHSLDIWFVLIGPLGAVHLCVNFPVYLPHVAEELAAKGYIDRKIRGYDLGYHSPKPFYELQTKMECDHLDCGYCYYDGSSLNADPYVETIFSTRGKKPEDVMWPMLEEYYYERFGKETKVG